jgi:hypothetical protein
MNTDNIKTLVGLWTDKNAGGCHIEQGDTNKRKTVDSFNKKIITWLDNPKYHISFESKERIQKLEFEVILCRSSFIWGKTMSNNVVNSMAGIYIFNYNSESWHNSCLNMERLDFLPKNEVVFKYSGNNVDPKGFVIMPATYGKDIIGPFTLMVVCKDKFNLSPFIPKKNNE